MQPCRPQWGGFLPRSDIPRYRSRGKDGETRQNRKKDTRWKHGGVHSCSACELWHLWQHRVCFQDLPQRHQLIIPPQTPNRRRKAHIHCQVMRPSPASLGKLWFHMLGFLSSSHYILCPSIMGTISRWHYLLLMERESALSSEFGRMWRNFRHCESFHCFLGTKTNWSSLRAKKMHCKSSPLIKNKGLRGPMNDYNQRSVHCACDLGLKPALRKRSISEHLRALLLSVGPSKTQHGIDPQCAQYLQQRPWTLAAPWLKPTRVS